MSKWPTVCPHCDSPITKWDLRKWDVRGAYLYCDDCSEVIAEMTEQELVDILNQMWVEANAAEWGG